MALKAFCCLCVIPGFPVSLLGGAVDTGCVIFSVSYMVRGRTKVECAEALDRLCVLLGAERTLGPTDGFGHGWLARAVSVVHGDLDEECPGSGAGGAD